MSLVREVRRQCRRAVSRLALAVGIPLGRVSLSVLLTGGCLGLGALLGNSAHALTPQQAHAIAAGETDDRLKALQDAVDPRGKSVVLFGAGGAARAIVVSLIDQGATEIRILNRTRAKADALASEFGATVIPLDWSQRHTALAGAALLVNTTNQGMHNEPALDLELNDLPTDALVSDAIYIPLETPLLAAARLRGNTTVNGLGMLIHQARPAFHAWFGVMPESTPALYQAVASTL